MRNLSTLTIAILTIGMVFFSYRAMHHSFPVPQGPYYEILASKDQFRGLLGWLQSTIHKDGLALTRVLRLSTQSPLTKTHYQLKRVHQSSEQLLWSFDVGEQRSTGMVIIDCSSLKTNLNHCTITFSNEGPARVIETSGKAPVISEIWPWQLSRQDCSVHGKEFRRSLIRPLNAQFETEGLKFICLSPQEAPKQLKATWGVRYELNGERGYVWWTEKGLGIWEAQLGSLSWQVREARSQGSFIPPSEPFSLEQLALIPIKSKVTIPTQKEWTHLRWARLSLFTEDGKPIYLLKTTRQHVDPIPSSWVLVQRGQGLSDRSFKQPKGKEGEERFHQDALQGTPAYPIDAKEIKTLLAQMISQEMPAYERAQILWKWVREEIKVQARSGLPRVLETLQERAGDCNEQSALLTTLMRSAGVPAEQVFGLVALGNQAGYHAWVRVWLDGEWIEIDPARGLDYVTPAHWAVSTGDERAQEALRPLLMNAQVQLSSWSKSLNH